MGWSFGGGETDRDRERESSSLHILENLKKKVSESESPTQREMTLRRSRKVRWEENVFLDAHSSLDLFRQKVDQS